ncbi:ATP phosphoribosyltransferase regulatory subunit [Simiduia curdlanivorans]|uniref:ATP phosphoribosyltransferase regulatory subunit n=1 Tax=Simiduia curdlanivorans TaxID=1492769 RepID=A0ABV8V4W4_9GAMM|nr:ATP phosphoribosyltransferase regulatory subunit [Simiduia curdlanivorans]MDN3637269.1 ATP phosphoribosyltransferase regulatory subunit [Simiduia curdlanivorans]
MTYADRWLLPDGIAEILPAQAEDIEQLRRDMLNLYHRWGYDLVIPPVLEFTDSLLTGLGQDLDLLTFKVTDQLSGRSMGLRADITPQTARMDAHSFKREGVNRLCYAGHVVHTRPKSPLATRTPIQAGVELFGEASLSADIEVVSLLLESLQTAGVKQLNIDLGHVGIYRALAAATQLDDQQEMALFTLLQQKAVSDIDAWVAEQIAQPNIAKLIRALPALCGGVEVLEQARKLLSEYVPDALQAIDELQQIAAVIAERYPAANLYFDISELRGYHYHTGLVFAAFAPGYGQAIANGGRYDHIGEVFGRARPATGFAVDLGALNTLGSTVGLLEPGILAPEVSDTLGWQAVQQLRQQGERVVCTLSESSLVREELNCDRELVLDNGQYLVKPISK